MYLLGRQDKEVTIQVEKYNFKKNKKELIGQLPSVMLDRRSSASPEPVTTTTQQLVPSNHDVAGEKLRHAGAPVPQHTELGAVTLEEA